jgi:hypothetical protein
MFWHSQIIRSSMSISLAVLALTVATGTANAEDPAIQRDMAASYGAKLGLSVDEAQAQLDRQERLIPVADRIRETLGNAYAGIWFDDADGSRMKIGITAALSAEDPALVQQVQAILATNGATDDADLVRVDTTQADLSAEQDKVNAALAAHLQAGDVQTSLDPTTNSVVVTGSNALSSADRADIDTAVAGSSTKTRVVYASSDVRAVPDNCISRSSDGSLFCDSPFRGAVMIGTTTWGCSAGFVTLGNSGGNPWVLTAGHCLVSGGTDTWSSRDTSLTLHSIGRRHSWTFGSGGDYGIIGMSTTYWSTSPYVVYDTTGGYNYAYHIYGANTSYRGMAICSSGKRLLSNGHHTDCGTVTDLNVSVNSGGTVVLHLGRANTCTGLDGNSGGPFFVSGYAYGLLQGNTPGNVCDVYYQGVSAALSGSNVHLPG